MKTIRLILPALLMTCYSYAQNTFPTTGSVGIGTTTPAYNLDVVGNLRATSNVITPNINFQYIGYGSSGTQDGFAVGHNVLSGVNNTGYANVAVGAAVLNADNLTGMQNVGVGNWVLSANTIGHQNVAIGSGTLNLNTTGNENVAVGVYTLNSNVTGYGSVAVGMGALSASTAGLNTAVGFHAGSSVTTGVGNTFLGLWESGSITGSNNTVIGSSISFYNTGITSGSGNTILGGNITGLSPTLTNHVILADGQGHQRLVIDENGNAGIGTLTPDSKLTVGGTVHATSVLVDQLVAQPDYVFDKDYDLASLKDVKNYIDQNHHLPEIPSAAQVAKEGINLGEINTKLLKKIEELTLYLIEKDKEIKSQQNQLNQIKKKLRLN